MRIYFKVERFARVAPYFSTLPVESGTLAI
jgi:hypothetical protein